MKEINPIGFRLGTTFFWDSNVTPIYYTAQFHQKRLIKDFFNILFFNSNIITFFNYRCRISASFVIIYFYYYLTNLQFRQYILQKQSFKVSLYSQRYKLAALKNLLKGRSKKFLNKKNSLLLRRNIIVKKNQKFLGWIKQTKRTFFFKNVQKCYFNLQRKSISKKKNYKFWISKFIYYKFLLCKFIFETFLYKVFNIPSKIMMRNSYFLLRRSKRLLFLNYKVFSRLHYIKRFLYFIDAVNIISFGLHYKLPIILLQFIINELHKTRRHRSFLNSFGVIAKIFIKLSKIYHGLKLIVCGPIGKHGRTKFFKLEVGHLLIQSYKFDVLYAMSFCVTRFGSLGVRVWIS
jgi:hypothetical protein